MTAVLTAARARSTGVVDEPSGGRGWLAACVLALMVASDYKLRVRSPSATLSGGFDLLILLEVGVFGLVAGYLLLTQPHLPRARRFVAPLFWAGAYVTLLVVSVAYSPFRSLGAVRAAETLVWFAVVARAARVGTRADLHRVAHGFLVLVAASVVVGVVHPFPPVTPLQAGRFTWLRVHPVPAGVYVGLATLLALLYLVTRSTDRPGPRWPAWAYIGVLVLAGGGLLGTQTRSAVLGLVAGVVAALLVLYRARRLVTVAACSLLGLLVLAVVALPQVTAYFARGESAAQLATLNSRTSLWTLALHAFREQPLYGYGLGASRGIFLDQTGLGGAHNAVVNIAVDLGSAGLLVWLVLLVAVVRAALRGTSRSDASSLVDRAVVVGVLAFLCVDGQFYEGLGGVSNVAADWLLVLVAWSAVLARGSGSTRPGARPALR